MASKRVTVFGGSGFLGRQIVKSLAAEGTKVRVAVRHPERAAFIERLGRDGQIELVHANVWDEPTVARAVKQSASVINTVGHYVEKGTATFDVVHGQGALHVARQAGDAGVGRLIHISGLGADPRSDSPYVRARGIGEDLVKSAFEGVTILRPSVIFGPDDAFFNTLAGMARRTPVLPLFGMGRTNLQPVFVGDVAEACVRVLADPATQGKAYQLGRAPGLHLQSTLTTGAQANRQERASAEYVQADVGKGPARGQASRLGTPREPSGSGSPRRTPSLRRGRSIPE